MNEYKFGRDTYIYDDESGIKISYYEPIAPPQHQNNIIGIESKMIPRPIYDNPIS